MRETSSPGLAGCLDAAVGGSRPQVLTRLRGAMPADMRLDRFALATVPDRYRDAFFRGHREEIDLSGLPGPMRQELAWCLFRVAEQGAIAGSPPMRTLVLRLREAVTDLGSQAPGSLLDLPPREWLRHLARAVQRRTGALPSATAATQARRGLLRCYQLLWAQYDPRPWWHHEIWDPVSDPRIPRRPHEPLGTQAVHFHRLGTGWLRLGIQWYCKVSLETGTLTWSTVRHRMDRLTVFDAFVAARGIRDPWLAAEPAQVRVLMLDFLGHVRSQRVTRKGPTLGQPWSADHVRTALDSAEQFYAFMHDNQDAAAAALAEPGWLRLGPQHARFYRPGEKPRSRGPREEHVIDDEAFSKIMAGTGVLGAPADEGGIGDEQAMRILMLLARTGRRVSELLLLDRDPLLPLNMPRAAQDGDQGAFTARLRYQQTKINGAPDTILVDQEVVAIIRAQQGWADRFLDGHISAGTCPKYLFLAVRKNRNGQRPYPVETLRGVLRELVAKLGIRDSSGRLVDFQRTHRFRHTKATSLINAGVPLHVVQRYLGHLSPSMTMVYAQTLASTHEAEFLRFRKLTADARPVQADPRDLYDMLQLDSRTDRVLPNGWFLLPPRQTCDRGNACLTCGKFATDATFLPELRAQKDRTLALIGTRQAAFTARTGAPMTPGNVWLDGRQRESAALDAIITALETAPEAPESGRRQAAVGAGSAARADAVIARQDERNAR
jgi:integrase